MLALKQNKIFFVEEDSTPHHQSYMRVGKLFYDIENKNVSIEFKFYNSRDEYENKIEPFLVRNHTVNDKDFEEWFNLEKINLNKNPLTQINLYLENAKAQGVFDFNYPKAINFVYNRDESEMQLDIRLYSNPDSEEESYISSVSLLVDKLDFVKFFEFDSLNSANTITKKIFNYIIQIPDIYPETLLFQDWTPELS